ncbi:MAG TPA: glycosyltransferase family 39 protein [Candidatus Limnocylindrales bacterium]|jgi:4-amino-4-deoxy-L-arabinose transferase-like glycosyltransferase|nr:glycosyltransferase family 39 protein [Candidatus Limnocylindrales bacterium]
MISAFGVGKLMLHFLTTAFTPYGIHRDEFLYLAMGRHLHFWRMDFPPAIALFANTARFLFGDTLFAIRFFPALAGGAIVVLAGLLAREFGGKRFAQGIAMCAVLCCGLFLRPASLFQPVIFDQLWWTLGFFALAKICQSPDRRSWWMLGLAGGLGLLTKFSIGFFAVGVGVGILLTPLRKCLTSGAAWFAVLVALVVGSPSLVGQLRLDLPVLVHMGDLRSQQLSRVTYGDFLAGQLSMLGPILVLALVGLGALLCGRLGKPFRSLGWASVVAFLLLLLFHGKPYYLGPIYPMLFAAGAATLEASNKNGVRVATRTLLVLIVVGGIIALPMGLPILPPTQMAKYAAALGQKSLVTTNRKVVLPLPQDYADMLGWEDQVAAVAQAYEALSPAKRAQAVFLTRNYGQAGALEFFGPQHDLTPTILLPNNFLLWPLPTGRVCQVVVSVGISPEDLSRFFSSVQLVTHFDDPWMVPEERQLPICVAEQPIRDLHEAWPQKKGH